MKLDAKVKLIRRLRTLRMTAAEIADARVSALGSKSVRPIILSSAQAQSETFDARGVGRCELRFTEWSRCRARGGHH